MSVDYVPPDRQSLIVVVMIVTCAWTGTLAVARSRQTSLRVQRISLASSVAIKWKRADARLLLALTCVPHTTAPYETIPLFLIPQTWPQAWGLWTLAVVAHGAQWMSGPYASQAAYWASGAEWIVALLYLPCLAMVLCRPNAYETRLSAETKPATPAPADH